MMHRSSVLWLVLLLLTSVSPDSWSQPVAIREFSEATGDNVVRIEARWSNGVSQSGFGYIVGTAARRVTVATARHVVATLANGDFQAAQRVEIFTRKGARYVGENVGFVKDLNGVDLGFVEFLADGLTLFAPAVVAPTLPAAGEEVWLQGSKGEVKLNPASGRVSANTTALVRVAGLGGVAGVSGAPVLSSCGIVGLYLGGDPTASVLQIGVVQRQAAAFQRTWTLQTTPGCRPTIAVQFVRADALDVPVSTVAPAGSVGLKVPGTYQLAPGSYGINFDFKRVECIPRSFVVAVGNPNQKIEVFCSPRLDGKWSSSEADGVVTGLGNGDYELTTVARNNLPSNSLRGRLIQTNSVTEYQTNISDLLGRDRSGSMVVSADLLEMKITIPLGAMDTRTLTLRRQ